MQNCLFKETKESSKIFLLLLIKTISQQCVKKKCLIQKNRMFLKQNNIKFKHRKITVSKSQLSLH